MTVITTETLGPLSQEPTPAEAQAHAERRERFRIAGQSALDRSRGGRDLEPEARAWALHWASQPKLGRPLSTGDPL